MIAAGFFACAFMGAVAGLSLAAVANALGVPARIALYAGEKPALRFFPWAMALGSSIFSYSSVSGAALYLPHFTAYAALPLMGAYVGMSAMSLAEILDVFAGGMSFLRRREFIYAGGAIVLGKAVLSALHLILGSK